MWLITHLAGPIGSDYLGILCLGTDIYFTTKYHITLFVYLTKVALLKPSNYFNAVFYYGLYRCPLFWVDKLFLSPGPGLNLIRIWKY